MSWIDVEHDRHLASAIVEELGEERAVEYFRWLMTQMLDTPLLRASWTAAVRVFGLSPATLVRAVPVAWPAVFRNFGIPKVGVATAQSAKLELVQVPEDVLQVPAYLTAFGGLFAGLIDFCDARGECDAQLDVDQRRMGFTLRWQ
jgi:hypothetical protein